RRPALMGATRNRADRERRENDDPQQTERSLQGHWEERIISRVLRSIREGPRSRLRRQTHRVGALRCNRASCPAVDDDRARRRRAAPQATARCDGGGRHPPGLPRWPRVAASRHRRGSVKRRRTLKRFFLRILVAVVIGLLLAGAWIWVGVGRPYKGYAADEQFVEIPQGAGMYAIGRHLVDAGVARDVATFRSAVTLSGRGRHLQAGEYRFERAMSARAGVEKNERGEVALRPLTVTE